MDRKDFVAGASEPQQPQKEKGWTRKKIVLPVVVSLMALAGVMACYEYARANGGKIFGFTIQRINDYDDLVEALKRDSRTKANLEKNVCTDFESNIGLKLDAEERKELGERAWEVFLQYVLPKVRDIVPVLCKEKGISEEIFFEKINEADSTGWIESFANEAWERIWQIPEVASAVEKAGQEYMIWFVLRHPELMPN